MRRNRGANIVFVNSVKSSAGMSPDGKPSKRTCCLCRSTLRYLVIADTVDAGEGSPECETVGGIPCGREGGEQSRGRVRQTRDGVRGGPSE